MTDASDQHGELLSLYQWLILENELRGQVSLDQPAPEPGQMGALADALVVSLGAGGAVTVLARSLWVWLQQRHSDLTVEIEDDGSKRRVKFDAKRVPNPEEVVRVLRQLEAHPPSEARSEQGGMTCDYPAGTPRAPS
ncbi:effector-associated constant component EACC1 [Saccharopolyspora sp. NPDC002376]